MNLNAYHGRGREQQIRARVLAGSGRQSKAMLGCGRQLLSPQSAVFLSVAVQVLTPRLSGDRIAHPTQLAMLRLRFSKQRILRCRCPPRGGDCEHSGHHQRGETGAGIRLWGRRKRGRNIEQVLAGVFSADAANMPDIGELEQRLKDLDDLHEAYNRNTRGPVGYATSATLPTASCPLPGTHSACGATSRSKP
eukprot:2815085-Rhodomonas_salina.1